MSWIHSRHEHAANEFCCTHLAMNFSTKIIFLTLLSISWGRAAAPVRLGAPLGWFSPTRFVPRRLKRPQRKRPNSQKRQRPPAEAACLSLLLRHLLLLLLVLVLALGRLRLPLLFDLLRVILPLPFEPRSLGLLVLLLLLFGLLGKSRKVDLWLLLGRVLVVRIKLLRLPPDGCERKHHATGVIS